MSADCGGGGLACCCLRSDEPAEETGNWSRLEPAEPGQVPARPAEPSCEPCMPLVIDGEGDENWRVDEPHGLPMPVDGVPGPRPVRLWPLRPWDV